MIQKKNKKVQWAILTALLAWGMLSFIVLAGEENPQKPLSLLDFFLIKLGAFSSLAACYCVGRVLNRAGYLPEISEGD